MEDPRKYHEILGLKPEASDEEMKQAYREITTVCISDTHGLHRNLSIPEGDILTRLSPIAPI